MMNTSKDNNISNLLLMGWTSHFQEQLENFSNKDITPARVIGVRKNSFLVSDGNNEWLATVAGRLRIDTGSMYPVTGDWVIMNGSVISRVLVRRNTLSRGASGTRNKQDAQPQKEQVIAANLDTVFIVTGLDRDYNLRRIERYLTLIWNCGINPVIILTKADLHQEPLNFVNEVESVAFGVPVYLISAYEDTCLKSLEPYLAKGQTTTMVGSSGAGKSTLLNRLYSKEIQLTSPISIHDGKGKHTTTSRHMAVMPQGGMLIDNPGIREIAFWEVDKGMGSAFPEIEAIGKECRFTNCSHTHEPGCMVLGAVEEGKISIDRLENFRKMKREMEYLSDRQHKSADRVEKERWKDITMQIKTIKKRNSGFKH
ncbi:ribosome small subunit-dependent GTPase A [Desulforegula conservatrix]|uniref:ribosome small subunit-dependent GTPase A n=1 Tax=Desulforegula conservatrix TaxID=153026 RepID=UPI000485C02B|nr:ribosome small subunit-dependent GTPase A [Desulforegula conservatrix]